MMGKKELKKNYVVSTKTGEVFIRTELLALRPDMTVLSPMTLADAKKRGKKEIARHTAADFGADLDEGKEIPDIPQPEPDGMDDIERFMGKVVMAIEALDPENPEQYTALGVPRTGAIEAMTGEDVSGEERDTAFAIFNEKKGT